jgi:hypothetical protein
MAIRIPFMDRIKMLSSGFINGRTVAPNEPPQGRLQSTAHSAPASKLGPRLASRLASAGVGRLRFGNQGGGYGAEHTHSNLG